MAYTVKKMAKLSGVSVRTLHWYDKIGLLKPAFIGNNGYRYYEDEQLFTLLYEILFFKDLGLSLTEIKELMHQPNNEKIKAMKARKQILVQDIQLKSSLLVSIDKTLHHFESMSLLDSESPHDFDTIRQREYEFFLISHKNYSSSELYQIQQHRSLNISKSELNHLKQASIRHYNCLRNFMLSQVEPSDIKVTNAIKQHYLMLQKFYNIDLKSYFHLPKFYIKRPQIIAMHNFYHARMSHYISNAIFHFSQANLELC